MKTIIFSSVLLLHIGCTIAQEFKLDASYEYMYSGQWDKAIQTYNVSRPFLTEKQPLLMNGLNTSISYVFKNEKHLKHGINLSYAYFQSSAENENFNNILQLHFINLGYILHYENKEKSKGLYSDLIISATSSGLFRRINENPFVYDETTSKAFGIGGDICLKAGYCLTLKNNYFLSPFISIGYIPYLYSPNSEAVINQTKELTNKNWTGILRTQIGLTFHLKRQQND
jgi:meiotically up-regulated gene 157 (Mug157) protein